MSVIKHDMELMSGCEANEKKKFQQTMIHDVDEHLKSAYSDLKSIESSHEFMKRLQSVDFSRAYAW